MCLGSVWLVLRNLNTYLGWLHSTFKPMLVTLYKNLFQLKLLTAEVQKPLPLFSSAGRPIMFIFTPIYVTQYNFGIVSGG